MSAPTFLHGLLLWPVPVNPRTTSRPRTVPSLHVPPLTGAAVGGSGLHWPAGRARWHGEQFRTPHCRRQGTHRSLAGARREPVTVSLCCAARDSCAARAPLKLAEGGAAATVHTRVALEHCGRTGTKPTSAEADQLAACSMSQKLASLSIIKRHWHRHGGVETLNTSLASPTPPQGASERSGAAARPPT